MIPEKMSAVVYRSFGGPEVLEWTNDFPVPTPREGEVLIRVEAASVNPGDAGVRAGKLWFVTGRKFPQVPGMDVSGVVVKGAGPFQPGDEVFGMSIGSARTNAEFAVLPVGNLARKPKGLTHTAAAALPVAALTAWQGLTEHGGARSGSKVLIRGASGGVGSFAVQLARHLGAQVTAVCGTHNVEFVRSLGADVVLDHSKQSLETLNDRFDLVFDVHGGLSLAQVRRLVGKGGRYVSIVPSFGRMALEPLAGMFLLPRMRSMFVKPRGEELGHLAALAERGDLKISVTDVLPMSRAVEAHRRIETGHTRGKLVLVPDSRSAHDVPRSAA